MELILVLALLVSRAAGGADSDLCAPNPKAATCILKFNLAQVRVASDAVGTNRRAIDATKIKLPVAIDDTKGVMLAFTLDGEKVWVSSALVQTNRAAQLSVPTLPPGSRREGGGRLADDDS